METLLAVEQHRNHYYGGSRGKGNDNPEWFGSSPNRGFREINCRSFQTGSGLLPSPFMSYGSPVLNRSVSFTKAQTSSGRKLKDENVSPSKYPASGTSPFKSCRGHVLNWAISSPKAQTPSPRKSKDEDGKASKKFVSSSSPIPINLKDGSKRQKPLRDNNLSLSEKWAGPAYSNSPQPSSLPIPKFSLKSKRTVSLELPVIESDLNLQPMAKSAPASPTREIANRFLRDDECATKTLRRILNLDIADD